MRQDFRFALRMITTHRWFSAAVIATLALGIGLNTMVFTLIYAVLFKPVPVPGGERLVAIRTVDKSQGARKMGVSYPDFRDYRGHVSSLEALEAARGDRAILSDQTTEPQSYRMNLITSGLFGMLHVRPVQGRDFLPEDQKPGAPPVVLLGNAVWKNRYGGADVSGRVVRVNGKPATVIGVMPEGFRFPGDEDLWMPLVPTPEMEDRSSRSLQLFAMLKPGVAITQARADLDVVARRLQTEYPIGNKDVSALVQTFHQRYNGDQIQTVFSLMMAAVAFVLLIACANVANMMLSRALTRRREISIRAALGASRWQVVRQLLMESLMLSVLGGAVGMGLAALGVRAFSLATQDVGKPYWVQFTMEYAVFGYFAAICIVSALLFGLVPALRSSRADVNSTLKDGSRSVGSHRGGRLASVLVAFQFALTLVLLVGAGVFMRSFIDKQSMNSWLPADRIMTARITLPPEHYPDEASRRRFFELLLSRAGSLPGMTSLALGSDLPGTGAGKRRVETEDAPLRDVTRGPSATVLVQAPGFFKAINLPVVRGRDFTVNDGAPGRLAAVVTHDFANRYWPGHDAIGKRFRFYDKDKPGEWMSVVGVAADMVQQPLDSPADPLVFVPYRQHSHASMALLIRSQDNPASLSAVRRIVHDLDQDLPLFEVRTLAEAVAHEIWFLRLFGTVFLVFAGIALLMAAVGIYGVMAHATGRRTQEIGVRIALGATAQNILRLVLRRGLAQLTAGLGLGLVAAFPAARAIGSALPFLTSPSDPALLAVVGILLAGVGLFACWLPARRASALHPVSAIRND